MSGWPFLEAKSWVRGVSFLNMTDPIQKQLLCVQIWMLAVQFLGLLGLIWYAFETRRMRKSSEDQVRISQGLITAAMDQVEGLSKPCIMLRSCVRGERADTILEVGAVGSLVPCGEQGFFELQNVGNGIALNVSYEFIAGARAPERPRPARRYVQNVPASQRIPMVESIHQFTGVWEIRFEYESLGRRRYRSVVNLIDGILTGFNFEEPRE